MQPPSITGTSRLRFLISALKVSSTSMAPAARPQVAAPTRMTGRSCQRVPQRAPAFFLISLKAAATAARSAFFTFFLFPCLALVLEGEQQTVDPGRVPPALRLFV